MEIITGLYFVYKIPYRRALGLAAECARKQRYLGYKTLLFMDLNTTDIIFTDIIIHAKVFSVKIMSAVIIMTDKVNSLIKTLYWTLQEFTDKIVNFGKDTSKNDILKQH